MALGPAIAPGIKQITAVAIARELRAGGVNQVRGIRDPGKGRRRRVIGPVHNQAQPGRRRGDGHEPDNAERLAEIKQRGIGGAANLDSIVRARGNVRELTHRPGVRAAAGCAGDKGSVRHAAFIEVQGHVLGKVVNPADRDDLEALPEFPPSRVNCNFGGAVIKEATAQSLAPA